MTPRRTQQQRREETIGKLVGAAVDCLAERGYAATTVQAVADRAGVSSGGLFRHFATRLDLVVAAADEVRRRQFEQFQAGLVGGTSVEHMLVLLRAACRAPMNGAWYELLVAARSDAALRARLAPFTERYHAQIGELARTLPIAGLLPPDRLDTIVFTVVHLLDGEALAAVVHPRPEQEDLRLRIVADLLRGGTLHAPAADTA